MRASGKPIRGHHPRMKGSIGKNPKALRSEKPRLIMVTVGILLFVAGFLVTVVALQDDGAASPANETTSGDVGTQRSAPAGAYLLGGILISLVGVVLATVGPAAAIIRGKV